MNRPTKRYVTSYYWDGRWWSMDLDAYDQADADARCKALGRLRLDGEMVAAIPIRPEGIIGRWFRRLLGR